MCVCMCVCVCVCVCVAVYLIVETYHFQMLSFDAFLVLEHTSVTSRYRSARIIRLFLRDSFPDLMRHIIDYDIVFIYDEFDINIGFRYIYMCSYKRFVYGY